MSLPLPPVLLLCCPLPQRLCPSPCFAVPDDNVNVPLVNRQVHVRVSAPDASDHLQQRRFRRYWLKDMQALCANNADAFVVGWMKQQHRARSLCKCLQHAFPLGRGSSGVENAVLDFCSRKETAEEQYALLPKAGVDHSLSGCAVVLPQHRQQGNKFWRRDLDRLSLIVLVKECQVAYDAAYRLVHVVALQLSEQFFFC